jgi:hypothetical protein
MKKPRIDAKQAVEDIRAGMDDCDLMAKYQVSARGLESLLDKLVKAGALDTSELDKRHRAFSGTVIISRDLEIVSEDEPQPPLSVQPEPAPKVRAEKTRSPISARALTADVRSGMDDSALMAKYDLSSQGLDRLLHKLVSAGVMRQEELDARMPSFDQTVDLGDFFLEMPSIGIKSGRAKEEKVDLTPPLSPSVPEAEVTQFGEVFQDREESPEESTVATNAATGVAEPAVEQETAEKADTRFVVKTFWYEEPAVVYLLMFTVFPLGFYLLHRTPNLSARTKAKAAGVWGLVLIAALTLRPGDSGVANDLVADLNKSGNHCHGEISGIFDLTLRIDWTSRTGENHVKTILAKIMAERKKLYEDGVRYLEYPNNAGTYNVIDFKTGARTAINQKALPWFKAEHAPPGR